MITIIMIIHVIFSRTIKMFNMINIKDMTMINMIKIEYLVINMIKIKDMMMKRWPHHDVGIEADPEDRAQEGDDKP